ncbi:MAG: formylglycine-generating enzyme family protein [Rivularia sp. (in: cyanobacteria)]
MSDEASSKFEKLIATLQQKLELTGVEIADILWLAQQYQTTTDKTVIARRNDEAIPVIEKEKPENTTTDTPITPVTPQPPEPKIEVYAKSNHSTSSTTSGNSIDIKVPDAPGLRFPLKLARAIRPLIQKIDSETEFILDEAATANRIAKDGIRIPVFQPAREPAFDLMLVVDQSSTMIFWRKAIQELQQLLEVQGAFRDVQVWGLLTNKEEIYLRRGIGKTARKHRPYHPRSLVDPSGKRLILVVSDCITDIWHNGKAFAMLKVWTKNHPVAIIQMLPQWLWQRTGLSLGAKVQFSSLTPRIPNQDLLIKKILLWDDINFATGTKIPIFTLEEESARTWSKMIGGRSDAHVTGFVFPADFTPFILPEADSPTQTAEITSNFRRTASPMARKLASLLSAAPIITLPIVRIIQAQMLPQSQQVHVAEVFLGGIIKRKQPVKARHFSNPNNSTSNESVSTVKARQGSNPNNSTSDNDSSTTVIRRVGKFFSSIFNSRNKPESPEMSIARQGSNPNNSTSNQPATTVITTQGSNPNNSTSDNEITPETNPDDIEFDFISEEVRNNFLEAAPVSDSLEIIEVISKYFAKKLGKTLSEFNALLRKPQINDENIEDIKSFALLSAKVLKRLGGDYVQFAEEIERDWENQKPENTETIPLIPFTFETVTVNRRGEIINREPKTARYFTENLPNDIPLEMVYIPGGTFMMGSPEGEGRDDEKPQHQVTVPTFFMGKYQVTQEQWKAVANLPQVDKELKPEPSRFKPEDNQKNNLPVEKVSWYDAEEFCKRLSKHTGKQYRLASEAEWEYACRAGTTTPFHFGETITSELANYDASRTFADESKGEYREKTASVGQFPPNAFGLHDMHGNVYEWCCDTWHENYEGAPKDGNIWIGGNNENDSRRVLRGGSWDNYPVYCRSASCYDNNPDSDDLTFGFRVVCGVSPQDS